MRIFIVIVTATLGVSIWVASHLNEGSRGKLIEEWETANTTFRVRVTTYEEKALIHPGAYYVFQSAPIGSENWQEIMTLKFDDPVPIPRDQVRFVDDRIGYIFMGEAYAVTTDSGRVWALWNSDIELRGRTDVLPRSIERVQVAADGTGTMHLYVHPYQQGRVPTLRTQDYGRHWSVE